MSASTIVPVLMAGGSGTRLWPLSRTNYPKQFLQLRGEHTLLQDAALRAAAIRASAPPLVVCGNAHRFIVAEQLLQAGIEESTILLEPEGRNTAPAAAVAAHHVAATYGDQALLLLMPADQIVTDEEAFAEAVRLASETAMQGRIVAFGVRPTRAETGFGYIRQGAPLAPGVWTLDAFVEKPDAARAQAFLDSGDHFWNGGMYLFRADSFLAELLRLEPELFAATLESFELCSHDLDFLRLDAKAFGRARPVSIDYAVMEHTALGALVPLDAGWNDVGTWRFLDDRPKDAEGNTTSGDVIFEDAHNNSVYAHSRLVTLAGVDDHVVVETEDAILITRREREDDLRALVARLSASKRAETIEHRQVYRPWGSYESIGEGTRFQVKRIIVQPNRTLSLQQHYHRAEHWVVVRGTARVTCDERVFLLHEDQSTYIPLGHKHRLENPGRIPLELIEVQSGPYLGEDDIVRFQDSYGRAEA